MHMPAVMELGQTHIIIIKCHGGWGYNVPGHLSFIMERQVPRYAGRYLSARVLAQVLARSAGPKSALCLWERTSQPNRQGGHPCLPSDKAAASVG